jgi:uncharacterized protein DUF2490
MVARKTYVKKRQIASREIVRQICVGIVFLISFSEVGAQQSDYRKEIWPEVDVFIPLKPKLRLFFMSSLTKVEETRDNLEGSVQASLDYIPNKRIILRNGYRYAFSLAGEDPFKEHRLIFEQTFRQPLPLDILVSDRNREEIRIVNGETSARYRNRLTLEREFHIGRFAPVPYGSAEVFYDNRFDTWNRNRLNVGVQIPLKRGFPLVRLIDSKRQVILDLYFSRQNDSRSSPTHVRAVGIAVNLYF